MKLLNDEQDKFLRKNVQGLTNQELTDLINKKYKTNFKIQQIKCYKNNHHISSGLNGQFQKEHIPANKGKKWDDYLTKEQQDKLKKTMFKKGQRPINYRPVGSERIDIYGYVEVKVKDPNYWRLKHHVIYEEKNGPIPKNCKVIFKDKNRLNLNIDNLALVSNSEELILNQEKLIYTSKNLTEAGILVAKIKDKQNKILNNKDRRGEKK